MGPMGKAVPRTARKKSATRRSNRPFDRWLEKALKALNETWGEPPDAPRGPVSNVRKNLHN